MKLYNLKTYDRSEKIAAIIGAIIGISLGGYLLVYLPMKKNIEENGCPFLECPHVEKHKKDNKP